MAWKMRSATNDKPSCKAKAVEILARSDQSIKRLGEKLRRKDYSAEEIEDTVQWLQEKRFLQEEDGCQRRFEYMYNESCYSLRQIKVKLQQKGYDRDLIDSFTPDDVQGREYAAAMKVIRRKFKRGADSKKMYSHLLMKGFGYDTAQNAVEDLLHECEDDVEV